MAETPPPQNSPTEDDSQQSTPPQPSAPQSTPSPSPSPPPQSPSPSPPPPDQQQQQPSPSPPPPAADTSNTSPPPTEATNVTPSPPQSFNKNTPASPKVWTPPPPPGTVGTSVNATPALRSPTSKKNGGSSKDSSGSDKLGDSTISVPVVAAIGVVAGIVFLALLLLICFLCKKKNKKPDQNHMPYYTNHAGGAVRPPPSQPQRPPSNWQGTTAAANNIPSHMGPTWGAATPPTPPGGWAPPQPPDMNSSNFSSPLGHPILPPPPPPPTMFGGTQSTFSYEDLSVATNGFSLANLLGQGGFGYVHKGVLPSGKEIAVKSLKTGSGQGEREFRAEVEIISRVHHRHLVSLVGYAISGDKRLLVYEFLPNKNLEYHLHGKGQLPMDFASRMKIALGAAKGLAYLHEDCHPRIIHRDIKSANILLDSTFEAKVADFGLAKLNSENYTHVSTRVMGTFGYLAPEYASSGKLTDKSDVFSFGVMLLELITGRRPVDITGAMEDSLVDWARPLCLRALEDGNYSELADPFLENNYPPNEMARLVACASASIRHSSKRRPKMSQIVRALEGDSSLEDLNEVVRTANDGGSSASCVGSTTSLSDHEHYGTEMNKIRKMTAGSGPFNYNSSEYGATSEYGLNLSTSSSDNESRTASPVRGHKQSNLK